MSASTDILHSLPVPGTIVEKWITPARGHAAFDIYKT